MLVALAPMPFWPATVRASASTSSKLLEVSRLPNTSSGTRTPYSGCSPQSMPRPLFSTASQPPAASTVTAMRVTRSAGRSSPSVRIAWSVALVRISRNVCMKAGE